MKDMSYLIKGNSYYKRKKRRNIIIAFIILFLLISVVVLSYGYRQIINDPPYETLINIFDSLSTYNITSMDVEVEFIPHEESASIISSIKIQPEDNPRSFLTFALSDGLDIVDARINGKRTRVFSLWVANFVYVPRGLRSKPFELKLEYSGEPEGFFSAFTYTYLNDDGAHLDANSLWIPFTSGEGKVYTNTTLVSPKDFSGVTGGRLVEALTIGEKNISFWEDTGGAAVIFHEYEMYERYGNKTIKIFGPEEYSSTFSSIASLSDEILGMYEELFGPTETEWLNIAFIDRSYVGTFYTSGLVVLGEGNLKTFNRDPNDEGFFRLLAHEIGHYYWQSEGFSTEWLQGNQWYVEGFTEYAAMWITGKKYGMDAFIRRMNSRVSRLAGKSQLKALDEYTYWEYSTVPYDKGPMMLESLRRIEGEDKLFEFMKQMSHTPESIRTIDTMTGVARKVFGHDYEGFFKHWIKGIEPVELLIRDYEMINETEVVLTVKSSHPLKEPLEVGVTYNYSRDIIDYQIEEGINELVVPMEYGASGIEIDPRRRVFQLSGIYDIERLTVPLQELYMEDAVEYVATMNSPAVKAARHGRSVMLADISFDHWHYMGKKAHFNDYSWELAHFMYDYDSLWTHLILRGDNGAIGEVLNDSKPVLDTGRTKLSEPSFILKEQYPGKIELILRWEKRRAGNTLNLLGGRNCRLVMDDNTDKAIEFIYPIFDTSWTRPVYKGSSVLLGDIVITIEKLAFGPVEAKVKVSVKGTDQFIPVNLVDFKLVLPDGNYVDFAGFSQRSMDSGFNLSAIIPFLNEPVPIGVEISGIVVQEGTEPVFQLIEGGLLWCGIADKILEWDESYWELNDLGKLLDLPWGMPIIIEERSFTW